ncbi:uncharacterized protein LOC135119380 [Zophobas morio]|uniref:uncharacterized protein LOC135119380 n=1 Tax=Zophobas morio TaxID=2755281 RepID=UPI003083CEA6
MNFNSRESGWSTASLYFNRVIQLVEEKLDESAPKTELPPGLESTMQRLEEVKDSLKTLKLRVEYLIDPSSLTNSIRTSLEQQLDDSEYSTPFHLLSRAFLQASKLGLLNFPTVASELSNNPGFVAHKIASNAYSSVGTDWLEFSENSEQYIAELKFFLENPVKKAQAVYRELGMKRLDLDAAKSKVRKSNGNYETTSRAENLLKSAQYDYDRKVEEVEEVLAELESVSTRQVQSIQKFIEGHRTFFAKAVKHLDAALEVFPLVSRKSPSLSLLSDNIEEPLEWRDENIEIPQGF